MTILEDTMAGMTELSITINEIDAKLDEVRAYIEQLIQGGGITPDQLQPLLDMINSAKSQAASVLAEADELDNQEG